MKLIFIGIYFLLPLLRERAGVIGIYFLLPLLRERAGVRG
jgi:hypothetical protein